MGHQVYERQSHEKIDGEQQKDALISPIQESRI